MAEQFGENPFYQMLDADPPYLIGREDAIRVILRGVTAHIPNAFQIAAFRGVGKSAILRFLAHSEGARQQYGHFLQYPFGHGGEHHVEFIYIDCALYPEEERFTGWLWQQLCSQSRLESFLSHAKRQSGGPLKLMKQLFTAAHQKKWRLVILLDHFDYSFQSLRLDEANALRPLTQLGSFVIAGERPLAELNEPAFASWLSGVIRDINLDPLPERDARLLIRKGLEKYLPAAKEKRLMLAPYDQLLPLTGYHPPFILQGAGQFFELQQQLASIDEGLLRQIVEDRLMRLFHADLARYWRLLNNDQQATLYRLAADALLPEDYTILPYLRDQGLVIWMEGRTGGAGRFAPFSNLWQKFILENRITAGEQAPVEPAVKYTPRQQQLLDYLQQQPNQLSSYADILTAVWQRTEVKPKSLRLMRETVRQLRVKLKAAGAGEIINRHGSGYEFRPSDQSSLFEVKSGRV